MRREEIDRLLARLSSGEITAAERAALYQAALDDQALFEEIFAEQALAEALADEQLRDAFLIRESMRDEYAVAAEALESALESTPRLHETGSPRIAREPVPIRAGKRRIPWWGWAVPAAVAASTVLGVFLFREPAREGPVAHQVKDKPVEMAQAKPDEAPRDADAGESRAAPPQSVRPRTQRAGSGPDSQPSGLAGAAFNEGSRKEAAAPVLGKSEEGAAAGRVEPTAQDAKDQPAREKANEVAAAAPAPPVMIRGTDAAVRQAPAGRADEADARQAPAHAAEVRATEAKKTAAPAAGMQFRAAADESKARSAAVAASSKLTAAERESAIALAKAAVLQTQDASGEWRDVAPGARVARDRRLRLKLTATEAGSWLLAGAEPRSVALTAGQTEFLDLPVYAPAAHAIELAFQGAESTPAGARTDSVRRPLGRVRISFVVE